MGGRSSLERLRAFSYSRTGYHLTACKKIFEEVLGQRTIYLYPGSHEEEVQDIPTLSAVGLSFGNVRRVAACCQLCMGVVADDAKVREALPDVAMGMVKKAGAALLELRQQRILPIDWPCKERKVSMRLTWSERYDVLWAKLPSKLRSQIRKAQK